MKKLVHFGIPKTSSSSIQTEFLKHQDQVYYMGKSPYIDDDLFRIIRSEVLEADNVLYDRDACKQVFLSHQNKAVEQGKKSWIFSEEGIVSAIGNPSFPLPVGERIERVAHLAGRDATAVIVLREQFSFLKSYYRETLKWGANYSFDKFCRLALLRKRFGILSLHDYSKILDFLDKNFANVVVYLWEDLIVNDETKTEFFDHFGIRFQGNFPQENSYNFEFSGILYTLNKILRYRDNIGSVRNLNYEDLLRTRWALKSGGDEAIALKPIREDALRQQKKGKKAHDIALALSSYPRLIPFSKDSKFLQLEQDTKNALEALFVKSNTKLKKNYDLPLEKFGYCV